MDISFSSAEERKFASLKRVANDELHKIDSRKLFTWPLDAANTPGSGANVDYHYDQYFACSRYVLNDSDQRFHDTADEQV
jgi:hypothetical protein